MNFKYAQYSLENFLPGDFDAAGSGLVVSVIFKGYYVRVLELSTHGDLFELQKRVKDILD